MACTESVGPGLGGKTIGVPSFSFSASGITLNTDNGALGYSGRLIRKGFDRRGANGQIIHPNPGDAIVATFYWINPSGSTGNIIDSVRDVYTDASFTPIGNTYHLVDFITAGGISMATYAATAVHFDSTSGYVFAVEADFRDSIPDGGVKMTAWAGVEDVFANALGSFHSASVSASTPTPVAPGPITIGPGSVAYGVSLSNGGVNIASRPAGWTNVGGGIGSDGRLQDDGDYYLSPSGETINPQWTWDFQHASTALATVLELKPGTNATNQPPTANFTSSCSALACSFTSTSSDPDGSITAYSWNFGDGATSTVQNPSHTYAAGGTYTVTLTVTDNQGAQSAPTSRTVTVTAANQSPTANFTSSCSGLSCNFTSTSSDPDGSISAYSWTFGDGATSTAQNPSHTYAAGGTYTVTLRVTDNQGAQSTTTSKSVTVTVPNSPPVVNAGPDETVVTGLLYSSTQTFSDANGNGPWTYRIVWGDGSVSTGTRTTQGSFTVGHTYVIFLPQSFTVSVTVTDAAGASATDTKVVSVLLL